MDDVDNDFIDLIILFIIMIKKKVEKLSCLLVENYLKYES